MLKFFPLLVLLLIVGSLGCEVNRARSLEPRRTEPLTPSADVDIPGPYLIGTDGSVTYQAVPRPNGHLVDTRVENGLTQEQVDPWIRRTCRYLGGSLAYVRSIVGPYRLDPKKPDDEKNPRLYDVTIEIWQPRGHDH